MEFALSQPPGIVAVWPSTSSLKRFGVSWIVRPMREVTSAGHDRGTERGWKRPS